MLYRYGGVAANSREIKSPFFTSAGLEAVTGPGNERATSAYAFGLSVQRASRTPAAILTVFSEIMNGF